MIGLVTWGVAAQAQDLPGDVAKGRALALDICSQCHDVEKDGPDIVLPDPPSFQTLADDPAMTALAIGVFLRTPHRNMPNLILRDDEIDDLIAYIHSLR